ncbi:hypothetical protein [Prosthecobacter sp.]|uniref:hypothetical protein n=1 Tax=Prosthecobacter sp. TaxID=1965333 RepID=UPI001DA14C1F|nr:hypothetical protein [Prosthecobacter sp.]MCB1278490.1 hypothetical protein [Prosthecobacter sp.]
MHASFFMAFFASASLLHAQAFFVPPAPPPEALPADKVFPSGRVFPFIGFSGNAKWQRENGYTVHGPVYGDEARQMEALAEAKAAGLPFIFKVGLEMNFLGKNGSQPVQMKPDAVREAISKQAAAAMTDPAVCWWYVTPEELRYWIPSEMDYLEAAKKALSADPQQRPMWMYEPNDRDANALALTGKHQDIVGKGFYANLAGFKDDRVWIRWSAEQETAALKKLGRKNGLALVMPELIVDPEPADEPLIPIWARHDVYAGLINGCKGVVVYSLFKRPEVAKTHEAWMTAYSTVAKELTGSKALGQVFLFGEPRKSLVLTQTAGPPAVELLLGKARGLEAADISAKDRRKLTEKFPAFSSAELAYGTSRYLFLTNDTASTLVIEVKGFPKGCEITSVFDESSQDSSTGILMLKLDKWGAAGLRFSAPGTIPAQRWKSTDGREIEAQFVRLDGEDVLLTRAGKPFKVPLAKLAAESQELARRLGNPR